MGTKTKGAPPYRALCDLVRPGTRLLCIEMSRGTGYTLVRPGKPLITSRVIPRGTFVELTERGWVSTPRIIEAGFIAECRLTQEGKQAAVAYLENQATYTQHPLFTKEELDELLGEAKRVLVVQESLL